jgi:hypothetical protein
VDSYRKHIWQCDGPCRTKPPSFGLVKRMMNRAPGKSDFWWEEHEAECGGTYVKIAEPEKTKKQIEAMSARERAGRQKNKLDGWIKSPKAALKVDKSIAGVKRSRSEDDFERNTREKYVDCPICPESVVESKINEHLDAKHPI